MYDICLRHSYPPEADLYWLFIWHHQQQFKCPLNTGKYFHIHSIDFHETTLVHTFMAPWGWILMTLVPPQCSSSTTMWHVWYLVKHPDNYLMDRNKISFRCSYSFQDELKQLSVILHLFVLITLVYGQIPKKKKLITFPSASGLYSANMLNATPAENLHVSTVIVSILLASDQACF